MPAPTIPVHHDRPMTITGSRLRCAVCGREQDIPPDGIPDPPPQHCGTTMVVVRALKCDICGDEALDTIDIDSLRGVFAGDETMAPTHPTPPPGVESLVGTTLSGYRIVSKLGRGGMAVVYKAEQPNLDRHVAVKLLWMSGPAAEGLLERFRQEARMVAALRHPNIVTVYDFGEWGGMPYLVMEYVGGETLASKMGQRISPTASLSLVSQVARALDYAHTSGVIHRDVKPSNILLARDDWALLSDFGIAKALESPLGLTQTGTAIGTPEYMSPEQCQGMQVDARSDLYALGVVLFQMVTGRPPFVGDTPISVIVKHISEPPPAARSINPDTPEPFEQILLKALAKDPSDRYATAGEMADHLEDLRDELGGRRTTTASAPVQAQPPAPVETPETPVVPPETPVVPPETPGVPVEVTPVRPKRLFLRARFIVPVVALIALVATAAFLVLSRDGDRGLRTLQTDTKEDFGIVFASDVSGNRELYHVQADGSGLIKLTDDPGPDIWPAWSPDGRKIVFSRRLGPEEQLNSEIFVMDSDGQNIKRLTNSPSEEPPDPELPATYWVDVSPSWYPSGSRILFASGRPAPERGGILDIFRMNVDGTGVTPLTAGPGESIGPAISPDGNKIAFSNDRNGNFDIFLMDADGKGVTLLVSSSGYEADQAWSPDGERIAFTSDRHGSYDLFVVDMATSEVTRLTSDIGSEIEPTWSPDGKRLLFVSNRGGSAELWIMNADGSGATVLPGTTGAATPWWT